MSVSTGVSDDIVRPDLRPFAPLRHGMLSWLLTSTLLSHAAAKSCEWACEWAWCPGMPAEQQSLVAKPSAARQNIYDAPEVHFTSPDVFRRNIFTQAYVEIA